MKMTYQCEMCGAVYDSLAKCMACEEKHERPKRLAGRDWAGEGDVRYPAAIEVMFTDGEKILYERKGRKNG